MNRKLTQIIPSKITSDGAGVKLRRSLGQSQQLRLDPFLMLDEFSSDNPDDYIAGFPPHPHRGFETVTYMLEGHMLHEDHLGNKGHLKTGGVQWMTAGRGIIHSEMPQQEQGTLRGFQLWINLPAKEKLKPAGYLDIQKDEIPLLNLGNHDSVKVIAGTFTGTEPPVSGPIHGMTTEPLFLDIVLAADHEFCHFIQDHHNAFIYVYEGELTIRDNGSSQLLNSHAAGLLSPVGQISVKAGAANTRFLLLAGKPLNEPIVQHGPFVMNTQEEIDQAIRDFKQSPFV